MAVAQSHMGFDVGKEGEESLLGDTVHVACW